MGGNSALLQLTVFALCFFHQPAKGCLGLENSLRECSKNVTVSYHFTEGGNYWKDGKKLCKSNMHDLAYPAVVGNVDEMCIFQRQMVSDSVTSTSIEFARNISTPQFWTNTSFLGIPLNLPSSNWSGQCLVLLLNGTCKQGPAFHWELEDCQGRDTRARYCLLNESRPYWNVSGTNNVLPGIPRDPIEVEEVILGCTRGLIEGCDYNRFNGSIKVKTLEGIKCVNQTAQFDYYSAKCPPQLGKSLFVTAEISSKIFQIRDFVPESFRATEEANTRHTILCPPGNKVFSISVLSTQGTTISSINITFKCRLDYKRLFMENFYDLSHDSDDAGLLSTSYRYIDHEPIGAFLDYKTKMFSTTGVSCRGSGEIITCRSNHTTVFAVLLSVRTVKIPKALKVCALVTQSISVLFLFLTFVILLKVRKKVRGERIPIQINLSLSLLLLHFWLLWGDIAIHYQALCKAIAVLTYFFLLSSALWMMNEAHLLLFRTSKWAALATKRRKIVVATLCVGWGIPVIITSITAAVGFSRKKFMALSEFAGPDGHEKGPLYENCLLNAKNGMRMAAIIPVAIILTYNLVVAIWAVAFVHRKRLESKKYMPSNQEINDSSSRLHNRNFGDILHSLKVIFLLVPVLGIPWILTLLSNWGPETVKLGFMYTNTLINGLQGLFLFIIYCIADTNVRDASKSCLVPLSSAWTSVSGSPEKSHKSNANKSRSDVTPARKQSNVGTLKTDPQ